METPKRILLVKDQEISKELDYLVKQLPRKDQVQKKIARSLKRLTANDIKSYTNDDIIIDEDSKRLVVRINNRLYYVDLTDMDGTYWTDLRSPATAINPPGLISDPTFDTVNMGWSFKVNNEVQIISQMPHEWKEGTSVNFHVHYKQTTSAAVGWEIDYRIYNNNALIPSFTTGLAISTVEFTYPGSGTFAQIQQPTSFIDMSDYRISCLIEVKLRRIADSAPTDVVLTEFDVHYQKDAIGSKQEFIK